MRNEKIKGHGRGWSPVSFFCFVLFLVLVLDIDFSSSGLIGIRNGQNYKISISFNCDIEKTQKAPNNGTQARISDSERTRLLAGEVCLPAGLDDRVYGRPRDVLLALWG